MLNTSGVNYVFLAKKSYFPREENIIHSRGKLGFLRMKPGFPRDETQVSSPRHPGFLRKELYGYLD